MAKIVCVLYEDPVTGFPEGYARDDIPRIERYPGGQTTPTPKAIDFKPGQLARQRVRRARLAQVSGVAGPHI
jgi:formate dehydrogenase